MSDRKRVLVADDDPDFLELVRTALAYEGYEVLPVSDGRQAVQTAMAQKFDLVLLDIMMPYIDGYHAAHEISDKLGSEAPPILIMTSRDADKEKGIALMSGAEEVIQKPFEIAQLQARIKAILSRKKPA